MRSKLHANSYSKTFGWFEPRDEAIVNSFYVIARSV